MIMYCRSILVVFAIGLVSGCGEREREVEKATIDSVTSTTFNAAAAPTIEFSVPDMMCPEGCGVAVKGILAKQPGAKDVFVDFDAKTVTVAIEDGKFDSDRALAALVDKQFMNSSLKDGVAAKPQAADEAVH
jgi:copper chaperone CopZ